MNLTNEIKSFLLKNNADIIGFSDLKSLNIDIRENYNYGIVIGLKYSKEAILNNENHDLEKYYQEFNLLNKRLDKLAKLTEEFLVNKGYSAKAKLKSATTTTNNNNNNNYSSDLHYKTVATLAGIGWIGKSALLVTNKFGAAVRIVVVLTDAKLNTGIPIEISSCPYTCNICKNICPADAISGRLWNKDVKRDDFYDAKRCFKSARKFAKEKLDIDETICGLCISSCPFTKKALKY